VKNLTRDEARARAALLDVASYDIALDLTGDETGFGSQVTVRFSCRQPGASSFAELDAELLEATLNGAPVGPLEGNRLPLRDLAADNVLTVRARCSYSHTGEGLHRFVDPADGAVYLWGQSALDDCQAMFACFDQPDLKASMRLTVNAPAGWIVIANGSGEQRGHRWHFAPTERMSPYLFTVLAGEWHSVRGEHNGIELGLHCRRSLAEHLDADAAEVFELTRQSFDFQQELFGRRYPFGDSYDQLFVPEFNWGAMENPGAVTFSEDFLFRSRVTADRRRKRAMVVAHEMAHMWFGNLVTMQWWDDLWLNESFAELMGYLTVERATDFTGTWEEFSATRKAWGYWADQLPSTHPVQGDVPDTRSALLNFDGISYAKGASVLRQLMADLGEDAFFGAVRSYLDRHAFANTAFGHLLVEFEAASGRDLQTWARVWLQTARVSTLRPVVGEVVEVVQESEVLRPHRIGVGLYNRDGAVLRLRTRLDVQVEGERTRVDLGPSDPPDLLLLNDGDLTFAKVRFDERSLATVLTHLRLLNDSMARAVCWSALWDTCRDAELPAASFVDAVLTNLSAETEPAVAAALLNQARTAALFYASEPAPLLGRLAHASWRATHEAGAGSDLQLVHVRAFASAARGEDVAPLRALLDGTDVPQGLAVDTELRWHLLKVLAALGQADEADIGAELARDDTAAGRLHALAARSSRPDARAKARAWETATSDRGLSNHETRAVASGFWRPFQDDLLREYTGRYASELPAVWAARGPQVSRDLAQLLFPSTLIEPAVLEATAPLLDEHQPEGLRRCVAEQRADLARALRARGYHLRDRPQAGGAAE
jgi:aminopeptidase N